MSHSPAEIFKFYQKSIAPFAASLERSRQQALGWAVASGGGAVLFCVGRTGKLHHSILLVFFGLLLALVGGLMARLTYNSYSSQFRQTIVNSIISFFDPRLQYAPYAGIDESIFYLSGLFDSQIDVYKGEDLITGAGFSASAVHAQHKVHGSRGRQEYQTIFKGMFYVADAPKNFRGQTLIKPDRAERFLGAFGRTLQAAASGGNLVQLENPEFEKYFKVESTDQVEARYLISTTLMQRLLEFRAKAQGDVWMSFTVGKVYIAVSRSRGLFAPSLWTATPISVEEIQHFVSLLEFITTTAHNLQLDQTLWKQQG